MIAKLRREEHLRLKIWAGGREYVIAHGKKRSSEKEDHDKQHLATLKRLKHCDENELERKLRQVKMVANKQLRLAMETEEGRRARLENDATK